MAHFEWLLPNVGGVEFGMKGVSGLVIQKESLRWPVHRRAAIGVARMTLPYRCCGVGTLA